MSSIDDDEELDPRIQDKLEELNNSTNVINQLEKQFEESNAYFRTTLNESSTYLKRLAQKLGTKSVEEARLYYDTFEKAVSLQLNCQRAAVKYERACQLVTQAKETISTAEQKFKNQKQNDFDSAWQEVLNHATVKLMEAESTKCQSELEHRRCMQKYLDEERRVTILERQLKRVIQKSKPYFDESALVQHKLNDIKEKIEDLSKKIYEAKKSYAKTLKDLELISDEIHEKRAQLLIKSLKREPGVGAENQEIKSTNYEVNEVSKLPQLRVDASLPNLSNLTTLSLDLSHSTSSLQNEQDNDDDDDDDDCDRLAFSLDSRCNLNTVPFDDNSQANSSTQQTNSSNEKQHFIEVDLTN